MRTLVVLAVIACAITARPGRVQAQQNDIIRGRVTSVPAGGGRGAGGVLDTAGIAGVSVKATSYFGAVTKATTTDKSGRFTLIFTNGEGDYWLDFTKIGYRPERREIKRIGEEEVLIANVRMGSTIATLDSVRVVAPIPGVRTVPNKNAADPDVSGAARALNTGDVAADLIGNLAAMAGGIPGIQFIPGLNDAADMFSALGLTGDQNNTTFNGLGSGVNVLPPDIIASTSIQPYSFDPSIGGFSGAQISIKSASGSNFSRRLVSNGNIVPPLEWTDATASAQSQKYTSLRLGGNAAGPFVMDKAFYNTAYNVSRRFNDARTLFNTNSLGLAAAGVSTDSVARLNTILRNQGIPASFGGIPGDQSQTALQGSASFDLTPSRSGTGSSYAVSMLGNYQKSEPLSQGGLLLSTPAHAGTSTRWGGNTAVGHTAYFWFGILSRTTLGFAMSRADASPYLDLPEGLVRVQSDLSDSTSPVRSLFFGGGSTRSHSATSTVQLNNQLSWYSLDNLHTFKLTTSVTRAGFSTNNGAGTRGAFAFNSLADLDSGRPASFIRTLSDRRQSAAQIVAAASIGDYFRPTEALQIQYGVRADANRFLVTPAFNQAVLDAFGVRNDAAPNRVYFSPRLGLQWKYGVAPTVAYAVGAARPPAAVIHAGVGVFQNLAGPELIGGALTSTGLPSSTQSMACVGDAVPVPDWSGFLTNPDLIPAQCADGSAGTVFSSVSPSVSLFDANFRQARSLRGAADWSGPIVDNRFVLGVQGVVTRGLHQTGLVDINLDTTARFTLTNEGGRQVFVEPSAIVPATGAIAPVDSRVSPSFQRVFVERSGLHTDSRLFSINVSPVTANRYLKWDLTYTLLDVDQTFYGFSSTAGNPFDVGHGSSLQSGRHRVRLTWRSIPIYDWVYISASVQMQSGPRYTPRISGDVNGDGLSNDRAYIADPSSNSDPAVASGIQSLLSTGSRSARECLAHQLGHLAARGSCQAPWTATGGLQFNFNPAKLGLPKRATLSLSLQNPLAVADLALHGRHDVRGWGQAIPPDQTLLVVRGFDPATQQFKYDVNQRFGSTRPQQAINSAVPYVSIALRLDVGEARERQTLSQRLDAGRTRAGAKVADQAIWQLGVSAIPNPMWMILQQADSLKLTRAQADSIAWLSHIFAVLADSTWTPAARKLAALPNDYRHGEAYSEYVAARERTVDYLLGLIPDVKRVLTAKQRRKLPLQIANYLDERVLKFLRSSTLGDASSVVR